MPAGVHNDLGARRRAPGAVSLRPQERRQSVGCSLTKWPLVSFRESIPMSRTRPTARHALVLPSITDSRSQAIVGAVGRVGGADCECQLLIALGLPAQLPELSKQHSKLQASSGLRMRGDIRSGARAIGHQRAPLRLLENGAGRTVVDARAGVDPDRVCAGAFLRGHGRRRRTRAQQCDKPRKRPTTQDFAAPSLAYCAFPTSRVTSSGNSATTTARSTIMFCRVRLYRNI